MPTLRQAGALYSSLSHLYNLIPITGSAGMVPQCFVRNALRRCWTRANIPSGQSAQGGVAVFTGAGWYWNALERVRARGGGAVLKGAGFGGGR